MEAIFLFLILIFSVILHEVSHGLVAEWLGDPTARQMGRITLNPLKHLDLFGSIFLPLMAFLFTAGQGPLFGYAKPVPVNPLNFREPKKATFFVSLAGPLSNILLGVFFGLFLRFFSFLSTPLLSFFSAISFYNFFLAFFNLLPIFPFDGFHVFNFFIGQRFLSLKIFFMQYNLFFLLLFLLFGLQYIGYLAYFVFRFISGLN
ncbi:MAG: site-2 protease family protein [Minisyncoccales bacterium]